MLDPRTLSLPKTSRLLADIIELNHPVFAGVALSSPALPASASAATRLSSSARVGDSTSSSASASVETANAAAAAPSVSVDKAYAAAAPASSSAPSSSPSERLRSSVSNRANASSSSSSSGSSSSGCSIDLRLLSAPSLNSVEAASVSSDTTPGSSLKSVRSRGTNPRFTSGLALAGRTPFCDGPRGSGRALIGRGAGELEPASSSSAASRAPRCADCGRGSVGRGPLGGVGTSAAFGTRLSKSSSADPCGLTSVADVLDVRRPPLLSRGGGGCAIEAVLPSHEGLAMLPRRVRLGCLLCDLFAASPLPGRSRLALPGRLCAALPGRLGPCGRVSHPARHVSALRRKRQACEG